MPERVVIVLVLIAGEDAVHPLSHHRQQRVGRLPAAVHERRCELLRHSDPLVELADDEQSRIRGEPPGGVLNNDRFLREKPETFRPDSLYTHAKPPAASKVRLKHTLKTQRRLLSLESDE
jgi:hypothetical protein